MAGLQGVLAERRFTGAYGYQGRVIGAVTFGHARWLQFYQRLIETAAPFPPTFRTVDRRPEGRQPVPADFPDPSLPTHGPTVTLSGYSPAATGGPKSMRRCARLSTGR